MVMIRVVVEGGLRLRFVLAACDEGEEVRVGCVFGVCEAGSELGRRGGCLGRQGGFGVPIGLW